MTQLSTIESKPCYLDYAWGRDDDEDLPIRKKAVLPPQPPPVKLRLKIGPNHPWVAEIRGAGTTYRFDRKFITPSGDARGKEFRLEPGRIYEVCESNGSRYFTLVSGGGLTTFSQEEVESFYPRQVSKI